MYKPGQSWGYKTRIGEESSTLTILKVENDEKLGSIVNVAVEGLRGKNPQAPDKVFNRAAHMPFSEDAITKSVTEKLNDNVPLPDFKEGYDLWRDAFENHKGGIFTVTVSEAVNFIEKTLNQ